MLEFYRGNKNASEEMVTVRKISYGDAPGGVILWDWHVFRICLLEWQRLGNRSGGSLWHSLLSQMKNHFFLEDLFSETIWSWCLDMLWMLEMWHAQSWLCSKTCNEPWAFNCAFLWIINTLVFLSASTNEFNRNLFAIASHVLYSFTLPCL